MCTYTYVCIYIHGMWTPVYFSVLQYVAVCCTTRMTYIYIYTYMIANLIMLQFLVALSRTHAQIYSHVACHIRMCEKTYSHV